MENQSNMHLGIIAGYGDLPLEVIKEAKKMGYTPFVVALSGMARDNYSELVDHCLYVNLGELQKALMFFMQHGVKELVLVGKVNKKLLIQGGVQLDAQALQVISSLSAGNDDSMLLGVVNLLEMQGIKVLESTKFLQSLIPNESTLTSMEISQSSMNDIEYGMGIAKQMGQLDIGQTVVVKNQSIMAVEAIEGTDQAICRGGQLAKEGGVVVKASKPSQDLRFDVPTIGLDTLKSCVEANISVLAFEASATIVLDQQEMVQMAEQKNIHLIAVKAK
ncbi:MAG: UDP-2,3-diacylglucosamine diphosphatase LpxI [Candidatus Cloacimonetes bacterium]|nr:UDP-2,3-diacylglucosamine diphosphatase LpxI [Candidatus Cloacimonadota bacterium]